jgi:hypothetical protein
MNLVSQLIVLSDSYFAYSTQCKFICKSNSVFGLIRILFVVVVAIDVLEVDEVYSICCSSFCESQYFDTVATEIHYLVDHKRRIMNMPKTTTTVLTN